MRKADFVGAKFEMNFGRTERHQTCYGGCLTIIVLICLVISTYSFISRFFSVEEVEVSTSQFFDDSYPRIKLLEANIYPIIMLKNKFDGYVDKAKILQYTTIYGVVKQTKVKDIVQDSFEDNIIEFFPFVPCSTSTVKAKERIYGKFKEIRDLGETFGLCPEVKDTNDYIVQGSIASPPAIDFTVYIYPCMGGDDASCIDLEYLKELEISMILPETSFTPKNYENPIRVLPTLDTVYNIHPYITMITKYKMKTSKVYDDKDNWNFKDFGQETLRSTFYDIDSTKLSIKDRGTAIFCQAFDESTVQVDEFNENDPGLAPPPEDPVRVIQSVEMTKAEKDMKRRKYVEHLIRKRIGSQKSKKRSLQTLQDDEDLQINCEPLAVFQWNSGGKRINIKRSYRKFMDTIGEMGGASEAFLSVAAFLYIFYTYRLDSFVKKKLTEGFPATEAIKYTVLDQSLDDKEKLKKTEEAMDELQTQRQDGLYLFKSLNHLSAFEHAFMKDYHHTLIPLALVNYNIKMLKVKEEMDIKDKENIHLDEINEKISVQEAFEKLNNDAAEDPTTRSINKFLLENLPKNIESNVQEVNDSNNSGLVGAEIGRDFDSEAAVGLNNKPRKLDPVGANGNQAKVFPMSNSPGSNSKN